MKQENRRHDIELGSPSVFWLVCTFEPFAQRGAGHVKVPTITGYVEGNSGLIIGDYVSVTLPVTGLWLAGCSSRINHQTGDAIRTGTGWHLGDISTFVANPSSVDLSLSNVVEFVDQWGPIPGGSQHQVDSIEVFDYFQAGDVLSLVTTSTWHPTSAISFGEESIAWLRFIGELSA